MQERSRSVKAIFALQKRQSSSFLVDNGAAFFDTNATGDSTLQSFQYRIGARYFPGAPCQTSDTVGGSISNGGAEAYIELQKALNTVGDYRLQTNTNPKTWAVQALSCPGNTGKLYLLPEYDYSLQMGNRGSNGSYEVKQIESTTNSFCGNMPSACFAMATSLETSNGMEISGLNAEEQSDISLMARWKGPQSSGSDAINIEVYTYVDNMIVLRENNVIELIY